MRGDVERTEDLFSYVPLADRVPSDHPLRSLAGLRTHTDLELSSAGDPPKGPMEILEKVMGYSRGCLAHNRRRTVPGPNGAPPEVIGGLVSGALAYRLPVLTCPPSRRRMASTV